jgi:hypothetical protein
MRRWSLPLMVIAMVALASCGSEHHAVRAPRGPVLRSLNAQDNPALGVACRTPNSIACDQVGVAVRLTSPAKTVVATIGGRRLELKPIDEGMSRANTSFEGFLHPAGLRNGPLRVKPRQGSDLWLGSPLVYAQVRLSVTYPGGASASWKGRVQLHAGYG